MERCRELLWALFSVAVYGWGLYRAPCHKATTTVGSWLPRLQKHRNNMDPPRKLNWVAVKEIKFSYHNMDACQIVGFLDYGNLDKVPEQQPKES